MVASDVTWPRNFPSLCRWHGPMSTLNRASVSPQGAARSVQQTTGVQMDIVLTAGPTLCTRLTTADLTIGQATRQPLPHTRGQVIGDLEARKEFFSEIF